MPIIDNEGRLIGSFSASDIKSCLDGELLKFLWCPLKSLIEQAQKHWNRSDDFLITCEEGDSIEHIMQLMVDNHIHRMFKVDENYQPQRVVSLRDILQQFSD